MLLSMSPTGLSYNISDAPQDFVFIVGFIGCWTSHRQKLFIVLFRSSDRQSKSQSRDFNTNRNAEVSDILYFECSDPAAFDIYAMSLALLEIFYTQFQLTLNFSKHLLQRSRG